MSGTAKKTNELAGKIIFIQDEIEEIQSASAALRTQVEKTTELADAGLRRIEDLKKAKHAAHAAKEIAKTAGESARAKESAEAQSAAERAIKSQAEDLKNLINQAKDFDRRVEKLRGRLIPIPNQTHAILQTVKKLDTDARRLQNDVISADRKIKQLRNLNAPGG